MRFLGKRNTLPKVECFDDIFDGEFLSPKKMHEEMIKRKLENKKDIKK